MNIVLNYIDRHSVLTFELELLCIIDGLWYTGRHGDFEIHDVVDTGYGKKSLR
ncbi:hypothetical protein [Legionella feeleii]|uniref:Uncharacterized protein n=1 Tax=Legionella feeleii TaxID=453 RepID=A0A378KN41_9GAMM|nr:hypothetical protein [Legionella feeleii]STX88274.1 Uncharacterised protein [Legionella feeleii]